MIVHIAGGFLRAFSRKLVEPIDDLCIAATAQNQTFEAVGTATLALRANDTQHIELADEVAEDDSAIAGRMDGNQTASLSSLLARKATFLLALIWIGSPVAGLRPIRAGRLRT